MLPFVNLNPDLYSKFGSGSRNWVNTDPYQKPVPAYDRYSDSGAPPLSWGAHHPGGNQARPQVHYSFPLSCHSQLSISAANLSCQSQQSVSAANLSCQVSLDTYFILFLVDDADPDPHGSALKWPPWIWIRMYSTLEMCLPGPDPISHKFINNIVK